MCTFCENIGHNSKFVTERNTHRNMQREAAGDRPCYATGKTLSVYRSRFEALPSIGSAIFAVHTV